MDLSAIANLILGGGLLTAVLGIVTLRSSVAKARADAERAKAEAERARADAESVHIANVESATRILMENIVKPLQEELYATREDLQATKKEMASTKREMGRLRKAVEAATRCPHSDGCPVISGLSDIKSDEREPAGEPRRSGEHRGRERSRADPPAGSVTGPAET